MANKRRQSNDTNVSIDSLVTRLALLETKVKVFAGGTATGTISASNNTVIYPTVTTNVGNGYNNITGIFTCPVGGAGYYSAAAGFYITGTVTSGGFTSCGIAKNGVQIASNMHRSVESGGNGEQSACIAVNAIYLDVGDTLRVISRTSTTGPSFAAPLDGSEFFFTVSLEK